MRQLACLVVCASSCCTLARTAAVVADSAPPRLISRHRLKSEFGQFKAKVEAIVCEVFQRKLKDAMATIQKATGASQILPTRRSNSQSGLRNMLCACSSPVW